jgi:hypothetical protein
MKLTIVTVKGTCLLRSFNRFSATAAYAVALISTPRAEIIIIIIILLTNSVMTNYRNSTSLIRRQEQQQRTEIKAMPTQKDTKQSVTMNLITRDSNTDSKK